MNFNAPCSAADMLMEPLERSQATSKQPTSPYPGLRPFEEFESRIFFGREGETADIVRLLELQQLVVVHGASGCGKSSVVRAGVIPTFRLDAFASEATAKVIVIRPSDVGGPLRSLARALEAEFPRSADDCPWSEVLVASPRWAPEIAAAVQKAGCALCLVLDQFEEIFGLPRQGQSAEVARVIEFLIGLEEAGPIGSALGERPVSVILTMRSDYLGHCSLWDGFAETVNRAQYLLPKISPVGLLRAIHQPALRYDGCVEEAVADRLLPAMSGEIDGLPILQHALMRAWQVAEPDADGRRVITIDHLERIGGTADALSRHAEEAFALATINDREREEAATWIFRALSDLDSDGRIIRRSVPLADLAAETGADIRIVREIVDVFRQPEFSLLMPYPPQSLDEDRNISVTHEALLRRWDRVSNPSFDKDGLPAGLVYREAMDGMIWRALTVQADAFASDSGRVLSAAATEQRLPWYRQIAKRPGWTTRHRMRGILAASAANEDQWTKVDTFMTASEENLKREQSKLEIERALVARLRNGRTIIVGLAALVLALTIAISIYIVQTNTKIAAAAKAQEEKANKYVIEVQTQLATQMAWRHCLGLTLGEAQKNVCEQRKAKEYFATIREGRFNENPPQKAPPIAEEMARRECLGVPNSSLSDCIAKRSAQYEVPESPYGAGGGVLQ